MSDIEQRSPEWFQDRCGKFTGSRFVDVMARNKKTGLPLKAYDDLIWQLVVERMTGVPLEGATGFALQWGSDVEPFARDAYELETGNIVDEVAFIVHPKYPFVGASPDGLIGDKRGLEMKCPKSSIVHLQRFFDGMPDEYIPQVQGCMWVTDRDYWDFVSYDPRMPESHRIYIQQIERDDKYISLLEEAVLEANALVNVTINKLMERKAA